MSACISIDQNNDKAVRPESDSSKINCSVDFDDCDPVGDGGEGMGASDDMEARGEQENVGKEVEGDRACIVPDK